MHVHVFDIYIFKYDLDFLLLFGLVQLAHSLTLRFSLGLLLRVDDRYSTSTSSHACIKASIEAHTHTHHSGFNRNFWLDTQSFDFISGNLWVCAY